MDEKRFYVYIGTYTTRGSAGIYSGQLDVVSGKLEMTAPPTAAINPSFLAIAPQGRYVYAVAETDEFDGQPGGGVYAFARDPVSGVLTWLNRQPTHGSAPCHLVTDITGRYLLVANYGSGTVTVFPVQCDGSLEPASQIIQHAGNGPNPWRQKGPHAHSVTVEPNNRLVFVCDLGIDRVMIYRLVEGKLVAHTPPWMQTTPGAGPRHMAFHPGLKFAYVINELDSTVTACVYNRNSGTLEPVQTVSTLPEHFDDVNTAADIHVSPDGRFVYASNRGHNSIALFAVNLSTGTLTPCGHTSSGGRTPRNFAVDPTGSYLIVANQDSNNVVVFQIDGETGQLTPTGHEVSVSMPVCVQILDPQN